MSVQGNKSEKKKRRRGKKNGAEAEGAEKEGVEEETASQAPTEVIKEIVTEDGTVMTIKEVIPGAQEEEEEEEEEDEEEDDGKITHKHKHWTKFKMQKLKKYRRAG